jgi:hypothetical protein
MSIQKILSCVIAFFAVTMPVAQAGLLDDLLKNPNIQGLIGRPDLNTLISACRDAAYRQANALQCHNVENAAVLSKLPNEMRVLMNNPQSASSLREICAAVQNTPPSNSYLCAELRKAETAVGILATVAPVAPPAPAFNSGDSLR